MKEWIKMKEEEPRPIMMYVQELEQKVREERKRYEDLKSSYDRLLISQALPFGKGVMVGTISISAVLIGFRLVGWL